MPQFHETGYGRDFFQGHLPRLIKSLVTIGTELKRANDLKEGEKIIPLQKSVFQLEVMPTLYLSELEALTDKDIIITGIDLQRNQITVESSMKEEELNRFDFVISIKKL